MAEIKHIPEPWRLDEYFGVIHSSKPGLIEGSKAICDIRPDRIAEGKRIVACVNACAGAQNPKLYIEGLKDEIRRLQRLLKQEIDDRMVFLAALERAAEMMRRTQTGGFRIAHDGEIAHEEGSTFLQVSEALDLAKWGRSNAS